MAHSMRKEYGEHGVVGFYEKYGKTYRNKHFPEIKRVMRHLLKSPLPDELRSGTVKVLDLACGSGEATLALVETGWTSLEHVEACDPFTFEAFQDQVGKPAFQWSFEDVANAGVLDDRKYELCVCSFALHLLDTSKLHGVTFQLASHCKYLLVLTPHKKPEIRSGMGFDLLFEVVHERIHARLYRSNAIE